MLGEDSQWLSHEKNTNKISSNRSSNTPGHQTMGMENPPFTSMVFPLKKKTSTSQGFLTSTIQINPATSAHEQSQAAGVLLHLSTHSVGQRQDLMSIGKATQSTWHWSGSLALQVLHLQKCHYMHRKWHLLHDVIPLNPSHHFNRYRGFPETSPCHWGMPRFKFGRFQHPIMSALTGKLI